MGARKEPTPPPTTGKPDPPPDPPRRRVLVMSPEVDEPTAEEIENEKSKWRQRHTKRNPEWPWRLRMKCERNRDTMWGVFKDVMAEAERQDKTYPWPRDDKLLIDPPRRPGMWAGSLQWFARHGERFARRLFDLGRPCWLAVLAEEYGEVARETDPVKREKELIQVAAVAISWVQHSREKRETDRSESEQP